MLLMLRNIINQLSQVVKWLKIVTQQLGHRKIQYTVDIRLVYVEQ